MGKKSRNRPRELDGKTPGEVYLCQVDEHTSCAACCGLYNVADVSRAALAEMLEKRTEEYARVPRELDAVDRFRENVETREKQARPFPEFHHCPFIGFIGESRSRVGCLLHPLAKNSRGMDFRGLSHYGSMACRQYFCPTHAKVPAAYKKIVRDAADDWHVYGLAITESAMINNFFSEVEKRLSKPLEPDIVKNNEKAAIPIRKFMSLKLDWPFRGKRGCHPAGYFFNDRLYNPPQIDYRALETGRSKYDAVFKGLKSEFASKKELEDAEELIDRLVSELAEILQPAR